MTSPKVTIAVPVYGVELYIERCARCLLEQTYPNIEFVFVDDCSPDNSMGVLLRVLGNYPKSDVKIIKHATNQGLAAARNTAIENATGVYVMHVDSDDYIEKDTVECCVELALKNNSDLVIFNFDIIKNGYNKIIKIPCLKPKSRTIELLKRNIPACIWCGLIRRSLYIDNIIKWQQ